jgi:hypothetical protein
MSHFPTNLEITVSRKSLHENVQLQPKLTIFFHESHFHVTV